MSIGEAPGAGGPTEPGAAVELAISGMHCESCVALVEEVLTEQDGVRSATVDLEAARAVVRFDPRRIGVDELRAAVAEAGYAAAVAG